MQIEDFNEKHITNLAQQIRNSIDAETLKVNIKTHTTALIDINSKISKEMAEIQSKILPLLSLPGPNPFAIVKYLKKVSLGMSIPQLEAYTKLARKLAKVANAINEITSAIQEAQALIEAAQDLKIDIKNELKGVLDEVTNELVKSGNSKDFAALVQDVTGVVNDISSFIDVAPPALDTSSPQSFFETLSGATDTLKASSNEVLASQAPTIVAGPVLTGLFTVGSIVSVSEGVWEGTLPITFTYQWIADGANINGATSSALTITSNLLNKQITCQVSAENIASYVEYITINPQTVTS